MLPVGEASHFSKKRMTLRSLGQSMEGSKPRTFEQLNGMPRSESVRERILVEPFACCT